MFFTGFHRIFTNFRRFEVFFIGLFTEYASIMFKPFLEQINGLEKAGTLKVGDQQSLLGSRGLLKVFLGVLSRSRTLQSLFW